MRIIIQNLAVGPGIHRPSYERSGSCIYCNSPIYSSKPGIRTSPLGAEHIIPEGLGGTVELPEASCQRHEGITGAMVEGDVLGRTLKALRFHLKLKKSGSGPWPKTQPLLAHVKGKPTTIEMPLEDYPIVFMMPRYHPPATAANQTGSGKAIAAAAVLPLKVDYNELYRKYGITSFATASWDNNMFCRMLAKIGHSFAVAELRGGLKPMLLDLICNGTPNAMSLIGGSPTKGWIPTSINLHELDLSYRTADGKTYVTSRVRLFAKYGGPIYEVVVGESSDPPIAMLRRVLSNRISRMLAR